MNVIPRIVSVIVAGSFSVVDRLCLAAPVGDLLFDPHARLCADVVQPCLFGP